MDTDEEIEERLQKEKEEEARQEEKERKELEEEFDSYASEISEEEEKDKEIIDETYLNSVYIINDFQTIGYGLNLLNPVNNNDIFQIRPGKSENKILKE